MVVVYAVARLARRETGKREEASASVAREPRSPDPEACDEGTSRALRSDEGASLDPPSAGEAAGTEAEIDRLGGIFAPRRETSDAELSVDVSILAGLRATYESTLDGTVDESTSPGPSAKAGPVEVGTAQPDPVEADAVDTDHMEGPLEIGPAKAGSGEAAPAELISVDMTRPLVYLTLVAKQERVSGRMILDALEEEGFRPGLLRLYYWRSEAEPAIVFGVANMVEPGVLDPDELPDMESPGLVTFMSIPGEPATAFRILDTMVGVGRRLARRLDAMLCDETRSTLTAQAENHLRETVADILRRDRA